MTTRANRVKNTQISVDRMVKGTRNNSTRVWCTGIYIYSLLHKDINSVGVGKRKDQWLIYDERIFAFFYSSNVTDSLREEIWKWDCRFGCSLRCRGEFPPTPCTKKRTAIHSFAFLLFFISQLTRSILRRERKRERERENHSHRFETTPEIFDGFISILYKYCR